MKAVIGILCAGLLVVGCHVMPVSTVDDDLVPSGLPPGAKPNPEWANGCNCMGWALGRPDLSFFGDPANTLVHNECTQIGREQCCLPGGRRLRLYVCRNVRRLWHIVRQEADGTWSEKPGPRRPPRFGIDPDCAAAEFLAVPVTQVNDAFIISDWSCPLPLPAPAMPQK